jgi:hypothetical protein
MQQLSQGNSEKARYSQVTVIHSHGLKHHIAEILMITQTNRLLNSHQLRVLIQEYPRSEIS